MELEFTLNNINTAAKALLEAVPGCNVFAFHGAMGAGKTTFICAFCQMLGVTDTTGSPTFSIINEYNIADGTRVYHLDLYRLKSVEEAVNAGVEDCLYSGDICLVEWPEKAPQILPEKTLHVQIVATEKEMRKIAW